VYRGRNGRERVRPTLHAPDRETPLELDGRV
jgi:hypothetical protein